MMEEHTVAIVSFEGAVKREVKRVREQLKGCPNLSCFDLIINAEGRVDDGEVKITFGVGKYSYDRVTGDTLQAVLDEFLRRRGWQQVHAPKALAYEKVPSDDTENPL